MLLRAPFATRTTTLAAAGALLLAASGAAAQTPPPLAPPPPAYAPMPPMPAVPPPPLYRNNAMRIAGITLTTIGSVTLVFGIAVIASDATQQRDGGLNGVATAIIGLPLVAGSALLAGIGIPLWVVGARPPKPGVAAAPPAWMAPTVVPSARGASLRWAF